MPPDRLCAQPRPLLVDGGGADRAIANFYLTTWEEFHTGTLFLSAFSGPVEGILLICLIYFITALAGGPAFWDQGVLNLVGAPAGRSSRTTQSSSSRGTSRSMTPLPLSPPSASSRMSLLGE